MFGFGYLGHIGIYDGSRILQVMNEPQVAQSVDWFDFQTKDTPWDTAYPNIPSHRVLSCFVEKCTFWDYPFGQNSFDTRFANDAIVQRAKQIALIGATYTLGFSYINAVPAMYDQRAGVTYPAKRGTYRCDTYVIDAFYYSHAIVGGGKSWILQGANYPNWRETSGETQDWANKMGTLQFQGSAPRDVYNYLRTRL